MDHGGEAGRPAAAAGPTSAHVAVAAGAGQLLGSEVRTGTGSTFDGRRGGEDLVVSLLCLLDVDGVGGGVVNENPGTLGGRLRRLLPLVGIGAASAAVTGLAGGPGSPAVAFALFLLLLGGLCLVTLHVLHA